MVASGNINAACRAVSVREVTAEVLLVSLTWILLNVSGLFNFLYSTVISTSLMFVVGIRREWVRRLLTRSPIKGLILGAASAVLLYLVYYLLWSSLRGLHVFEYNVSRVYSAVGGEAGILEVLFLIFPISTGFEVFYRGYIQGLLTGRVKWLYAVLVPASIDALLHAVTGNPVFMLATLFSDFWWGITLLLTRNLLSSVVSHAAWDIFIFVVYPLL